MKRIWIILMMCLGLFAMMGADGDCFADVDIEDDDNGFDLDLDKAIGGQNAQFDDNYLLAMSYDVPGLRG